MIRKIFILLLISICFSCDKKQDKPEEITVDASVDTIERVVEVDEIDENKLSYSISVEQIDSASYFNGKIGIPKTKPIGKITDFKVAKKLLQGIVEFESVDENSNYQAVTKINFKNGTRFDKREDFDGETFVAYFPSEDILLCEGGHTSDMSFNLKNGKRTEETGNPDLISTSPKNNFRLNGHFDGQECYSYFIQKKIDGEFRKIIQLDDEFRKITSQWLCTAAESFWKNEQTLYLTEIQLGRTPQPKKYFKIILR